MSEATDAAPSEGRRIARNSVLLGAGDTAALGLGFVTTILVTDRLGEDNYGILIGAQRFVALFLVLAQFGLQPLLVRAVASRREDVGTLLGSVLLLRAGLGAAFLVGAAGGAALTGYLPEHQWLLFTVAAIELVGAFAELFMGVCEGRERMGRSALVVLARSSTIFVGVILVWMMGGGLLEIVIVYALGRTLQLTTAIALTPGAAPGLRLHVRLDKLVPLMREAVPFVAVGLGYMAMRSIDVMMLTRFSTIPDASRYGAALNFYDVLLFAPLLVQRALLPAISRLHATGGAADVARQTLIVFSLVLVPGAVGLAILADSAVALYPSGEFDLAAPPLRILAVALLFEAPAAVGATLLTGAGRLWPIVACYVVALPIQVLANWQLLHFGAVGIAGGTLIAHAVLGLLLAAAGRWVGLRIPMTAIARHLAAAAGMGVVVFLLRDWFVVIPVVIGAVVYAGLVLALTSRDSLERRLVTQLRSRLGV